MSEEVIIRDRSTGKVFIKSREWLDTLTPGPDDDYEIVRGSSSSPEGIVSSDELHVPGIGLFRMAVRTRAGVRQDPETSPGLSTVLTAYNDGWTGDFGLMKKYTDPKGVFLLVVDPTSSVGAAASIMASGFVRAGYEAMKKDAVSSFDAMGVVLEVAKRIGGEIRSSGQHQYFSVGMLAIEEGKVWQVMMGDTGFMYFRNGGFLPSGESMNKFGEEMMYKGERRFRPLQVGYDDVNRAYSKVYTGDLGRWFSGKELLFSTDYLQKRGGLSEFQPPGWSTNPELNRCFVCSDPAGDFVSGAKGIDDAIGIYGKLE